MHNQPISIHYFYWNKVINCCKAPYRFEFMSFRKKNVIYDKIPEKKGDNPTFKIEEKQPYLFFVRTDFFLKSGIFTVYNTKQYEKKKKWGIQAIFFTLHHQTP